MSVSIEPLTPDDVHEKCQVQVAALASHPRMPMMWPRGTNAEFFAFKEALDISDLSDPNARLFKAVDVVTGKLVGSADWTLSLDETVNAGKTPTSPTTAPPADWPEGGNWEMRLFFRINGEELIKRHLGASAHIMLNFLMVTPEAQGRGIGSRLLSWGIEEADRLHVPVVLESTPTGFPLYKKFGFEQAEVINADMREFGWTEPYEESAAIRILMIRKPR